MSTKPLIIAAFSLLFALTASTAHASFAQQGSKLVGTGAAGAAYQGYSVALSADGNTAIVDALWSSRSKACGRIRCGGAISTSRSRCPPASAGLELLDTSGRRVRSREVGSLGAGRHVVNLAERRRLAPGLYWVRLTQGGDSGRMRVAVIE